MSQSYFVSATDTGVGKTIVTALLACALRARGVDAGVMKPFASGCERRGGEMICEDAEFLREAAGVEDGMDLICPARWEEPLAPLVAARRAGNASEPWLERVLEAHRELARRHECVIVEGVGGWAVPIGEDARGVFSVEDFATRLGHPVVLVARRTLGTLNHTQLSLRAIQSRELPVHLVFCDAAPVDEDDVAVQTSAAFLCEAEKMATCHVPFSPAMSPQVVRAMAIGLSWPWLG